MTLDDALFLNSLRDEEKSVYKTRASAAGGIVSDCGDLLIGCLPVFEAGMVKHNDQHFSHSAVHGLVLHICESIDGVRVLISQGCVEAATAPTRSAVDALFSALYMLEDDLHHRGLAYHIQYVVKRIEQLKCLSDGIQIPVINAKVTLSAEEITQADATIANYQNMLERPPFKVVYDEWKTIKRRDKNWFNLFGVRNRWELATKLGREDLYTTVFEDFSNTIHAGDALKRYRAGDSSETIRVTPLRDPTRLIQVVLVSFAVCSLMATRIHEKYDGDVAAVGEKVQALDTRLGLLARECHPPRPAN